MVCCYSYCPCQEQSQYIFTVWKTNAHQCVSALMGISSYLHQGVPVHHFSGVHHCSKILYSSASEFGSNKGCDPAGLLSYQVDIPDESNCPPARKENLLDYSCRGLDRGILFERIWLMTALQFDIFYYNLLDAWRLIYATQLFIRTGFI